MPTPSRRTFLKTAAIGAATVLTARSWAEIAGANGDVRVAVVGLNGRGREHLRQLRAIPGVRIAALCDVDTAVLERIAANLAKDGLTPEKFTDVRQLLASPNVDAITIATPNHWHALMGIWACEAGKDVFVEKPVSHNIWEGRQLVAAAAKYHRVVQAGMQVRSGEGLQEAVQWVRAGNLGKIKVARGFCYKRRKTIGRTSGPQPVPPTVDYDLWLGPAPLEQPRRGRFHYDWHWFNAYGNGDVGNQGIHQMDVARWFLGEPGLPRHTLSIGGRLGYVDDGETPNTQIVLHDYATAPLIFEVRGLPAKFDPEEDKPGGLGAEAAGALAASMDDYRGVKVGNVIDCEDGSVVTDSYFGAKVYDNTGKVVREFKGEDRMMKNFIAVVRSRRMADLYGPIEEGHISSALCHLGGISHQRGAAGPVQKVKEVLGGLPAFAETFDRMLAHLGANQVNLETSRLLLGQPLNLVSGQEQFTGTGAAEANALLTRAYRVPYAVPKLA
ncbi:Gfo/Idh/MocA family oxidoreductase [Oleiharenicola lentus]|jgi:predicted dehydrogenase|uniref:Gfo/Idh/MocA family oxidoreductase n=1 Tax=Oleiharenicola lentus TaxID=2508720 RepID=A0A4Q1C642_9BACT|nr:Gfo/Idh/MocA family oxidoreductase [Oleiharenicola lentus]RXK53858.1 Gfo/Idh/MocA family oxidoreductase [Oleiharenicola lentus]